MKRLLDETDASFGELTHLLERAERVEPSPFTKAALKTRLTRVLAVAPPRSRLFHRALLGAGGLLLAASAAAAGYSIVGPRMAAPAASATAPAVAPTPPTPPPKVALAAPAPIAEAEPESHPELDPAAAVRADASVNASSGGSPGQKRSADKPRAGEDPTQVAEAVRALRKQGDFARAQALLDRYLKDNPRGALAEDALALSIEAASARKDGRAADYARRYLARYPHGRFRTVAEQALSR
jgi:hypothetical protein